MSAVRRAALGSSALGAIQLLLFCTSLPAALHDWTELAIAALGLLLVGASVAVIGKVRWARRALVLILWLTATFSACELAVLLVLAFVTRPWPEPWRFGVVVVGGVLYYVVWLAVSAGLYLFLRSKRSVAAYGC